jgi:hypothetical protein
MQSEVYKRNLGTRNELLARILEAVTRVKKCKTELIKKKNTIFAQELQISMTLTVGFSKIFCEL